jgi:hypothetical protein
MMPIKNIQTSNENVFSMRRNMFIQSQQIDRKRTEETENKKKFYGNVSNRDASSVISKRAVNGSQSSFKINNKPVSYQGTTNNYEADRARQNARSLGYIVPPKVSMDK